MTMRRRTTRITVERGRGVFMISVAAELADMHPQTLRMYEQRGLIEPQRSAKGTRLYSHEDVERLRRIQQMTAELGLNLAGVETVLELEQRIARMHSELQRLQRRLQHSLGAEMVPYGAYDPPEPSEPEPRARKIPISRPKRGGAAAD